MMMTLVEGRGATNDCIVFYYFVGMCISKAQYFLFKKTINVFPITWGEESRSLYGSCKTSSSLILSPPFANKQSEERRKKKGYKEERGP